MREITKAESLKQQIYSLLKQEILNQQYGEEDILNERKISEELKVSRTPVREALKALEAESLVEYVPYKGIIVKKMKEKDLKNIFQIRTALEVLAVELAIENRTAESVALLAESHQQQQNVLAKQSVPVKAVFIDLDIEFHRILLKMADNELLTIMIGNIRDQIRRFGMNAIFSGESRYTETLEEHLGILRAVQANDVELAKEKMRFHMQKTYKSAYAYLTSLRNNSK
ncbi:MAG: GntR family transcriptional regulator [Sporomusaceae bacterium]|jgi:DNA-binding GntR family transcriptional regulator|nr:GntR family transcriptional regulator [Sporomusaceae bacterium]